MKSFLKILKILSRLGPDYNPALNLFTNSVNLYLFNFKIFLSFFKQLRILYKLKKSQNKFNCAQNKPFPMQDSLETLQSSRFTSQILQWDHENSSRVNPQQQNSSPVKKDNSSEQLLKKMNQNLSNQQCKNCESEEECCEFRRQKTFFCHPEDKINSDCCFQNHIPESQKFYQNSQNDTIKKPPYTGFRKSEFYSTQTFIEHAQSPRGRQISIKVMHQTQQNTLLNSTQNDNEKMTQSQQMIEQFDRQQLESEKRASLTFLDFMKSQEKQIHQQSQYQVQEKFICSTPSMPRKSILRQIQQKIKNEKKSEQDKKERFSLKQFYSNKILSHQASPKKKLQTQQLVKIILEKVQSQNVPKIPDQNNQAKKLVEILTMAFIPQFQRLQNQYKGEMEKIQQKIQQITKKNLQINLRDSSLRKSSQRRSPRSPLSNQSVIRINLNDDFDLRQSFNDGLRDSAILASIVQQRNEEFQRSQEGLIVPTIKRTDSQDQFCIPYREDKNE